jgi:hypothetical protein
MPDLYPHTMFLPSLHGQVKVWQQHMHKRSFACGRVIQLGNLIGANHHVADTSEEYGYNNSMLTEIIEHVILGNEHLNWVQLIGINEMMALNFPDEWTNKRSNRFLREAWFGDNPVFTVAYAFKGRLVTHAGLTYGEWLSIGSPQNAEDAARALNEKYTGKLYTGHGFLLGDPPNYAASPITADPAHETYPSWVTAPVAMPFDQIHGANSLNSAEERDQLDEWHLLSYADDVSMERYGSIITIKGRRLLAVDAKLQGEPTDRLRYPRAVYIERDWEGSPRKRDGAHSGK